MTTRVLVPFKVLEGETVSQGLVEFLGGAHVVLVGYHEVPDQTAPGQARMSFGDRAQDRLDEMASAFLDAGAAVDSRLVFTHDPEQTLRRVAEEVDAEALVHNSPVVSVEDVLFVCYDRVDPERLGTVGATLLSGREGSVTVLEVADADDESGMAETAGTALEAGGVDPDRISRRRTETSDAVEAITAAAQEVDAVFLGERAPSFDKLVSEAVFGDFEERIATESLTAVVEVLGPGDTVAKDSPASE